MFIDRDSELKLLEERINSDRAEFMLIFGRRRIGKTELVKKIIAEHGGIILMGREESKKLQLARFSRLLAEHYDDDFLKKQSFSNWDAFFEYVYEKSKSSRTIIALDEFPYLVKEEKALPSILQDYWDNKLRNTRIFLFLMGSSISMMERLLGYKSPIYGRRTGQLKLQPFQFKDVAKFIKNTERAVELYSVFGGTPAYITEVEPSKDIVENIKEKFLRMDSYIYQDVRFVLMEELEEPRYYFSILEAIAAGNASLGEIINYTGLARSLVGKYLNVLMELDLVRREISITAIKKTKKGIYSLKDNIFSFWFGFIFPYEDLLSLGRSEEVLIRISRDLNAYIGKAFEDIAKEFLWEANGGNFSKIGRWWYKGEEIDIVALNEKRKEITFFECKWSRMNERDAVKILTDLKRKATMVKWHNSGRKEHYGIIAKAIEGKEKLRENGYQAFDLQDLNATFCT
ncbi:MAG: ATP-binding protein [Euryarchaeota archaeon]|nr:ATP-binding protein [Euryarchaeota archaeon]MBU4491220.1 ATP-binding protein [Euryarchaeota archaeon]